MLAGESLIYLLELVFNMINKIFSTIPIKGQYCHLYPVEISDAKFTYDLRTQSGGDFLKKVGPTVESQRLYLKKYLENYNLKKEIYFKMLDCKTNKFVGVTRFCELDNLTKFGFESGIMLENCAPNIYMDAMFMCFKMGFDLLGRKFSGPWYVDSRNKRMIKFHEKIGIAKLVNQDKLFHTFEAHSEDYFSKVKRFEKLNFGIIKNL
jgi:hypothetical protein